MKEVFGPADVFQEIIRAPHSPTVTADFFTGINRTPLVGLQMTDWKIDGDSSRTVPYNGSASFVYADDLGKSIAPRDLDSWLAPYASYVEFMYRVSVGPFDIGVPLGRYVISEPSDPDRFDYFQEGVGRFTVGEKIEFDFSDRFDITRREELPAISQAADRSSVWAEIQNLVGWPITRTLPDAPIPTTVTYDTSRLDAIYALANILGGIPEFRPDGTLGCRPISPSSPVLSLDDTIISISTDTWSTEDVYNQVIVRLEGVDDGEPLAEAHISAGKLRYGAPGDGAWGRIPLYLSDKYVTTREDAQVWAETKLQEVSQQRAVTVTADIYPDPRIDLGDVVTYTENEETVTARVEQTEISLSSGSVSHKLVMTRA